MFKRPIITTVQDISIENIPDKFVDDLELPNNGGNCICVDKGTEFGDFLESVGFVFNDDWEHLVIFR